MDKRNSFGKGSMEEPQYGRGYLGRGRGHKVQLSIPIFSSGNSCVRYVLFLVSLFLDFVKGKIDYLVSLFYILKVRAKMFGGLIVLVTALSHHWRMNNPSERIKIP